MSQKSSLKILEKMFGPPLEKLTKRYGPPLLVITFTDDPSLLRKNVPSLITIGYCVKHEFQRKPVLQVLWSPLFKFLRVFKCVKHIKLVYLKPHRISWSNYNLCLGEVYWVLSVRTRKLQLFKSSMPKN